MKTVAVLIDFDNIFPRPIAEYQQSNLEKALQTIISKIRQDIADADMLTFRLYGGWYTGNILTSRASAIGSMLSSLNNIFPIIDLSMSKRINGTIDLATQLYGSSYTWYNSYRERPGIPNLRIDSSQMGTTCSTSPDHCPVKILKKFTDKRNRVCRNTGCTTNHSSVFFEKTQKYVDTMLACDIISLGLDDDISAVYVFSDDVDMFPAFAVSSELPSSQTDLHLLILNDQNEVNYRRLLSPFGVDVSLITL